MPELPEVETVKNVLSPQLCGRTIISLTLHQPKVVAHPAPADFSELIAGQTIAALARRGKFLQLRLASGDTLIVHLRMTGQLLVTPADFPAQKHAHACFALDDNRFLRFIDSRRFGRLWLLAAGEKDAYTGMDKLGPEPFDPCFNGAYLDSRLHASRRALKACLLDQQLVAGIGNIYSDEILFATGIQPGRAACTLSPDDFARIAAATARILQQAIDACQISAADYLAGLGKSYRNTPTFQVYGREGLPCTRCGTPLVKARIGGRSSCYCPHCQQ